MRQGTFALGAETVVAACGGSSGNGNVTVTISAVPRPHATRGRVDTS